MTDFVLLTTETNELLLTEDGGSALIVSSSNSNPQGNTPVTANLIQVKRRQTGDIGAPSVLAFSEIAVNEVNEVLWYGLGSDIDGNAVNIVPMGGKGAFLALNGSQTVAGIKTFSGELHIPLPTMDTQATNKAYVDTAITQVSQTLAQAITGAFHYKGTLDASTSSLPAVCATGDLYRVIVAGNFAGTTPFTASVGDHVVYNGAAWDKIDNTDPAIEGTDGHITVTRTGENSYKIDIADTFIPVAAKSLK